jgi:hypothetical protein
LRLRLKRRRNRVTKAEVLGGGSVELVVLLLLKGKMGRELRIGWLLEGKVVFWRVVGLRRWGMEEEIDLVPDEAGLVGEV